MRLRAAIPWIAIPLIAFAWFWVFRAREWTGGDSEQYEREVAGGIWFRRRQMLAFATIRAVFVVGRALDGWTSRMAFQFVSCAAGAVAVLVVWRMFRGRPDAPWRAAIALAGGHLAIFHGHVETYAAPLAVFLLHLLALRRSTEDRWPLWPVAATWTLFLAFHFVAAFTLPAMLLALALEGRRRGVGRRDALGIAASLAAALVFLLVAWRSGLGVGDFVADGFVHPLPELALAPWRVLDQPFWPQRLHFALVNGGVSLLFLPFAALHAARNREGRALLCHFVCLLGFAVAWSPFRNEADWDLFSFPWAVGWILCADALPESRWRALWAGALLGGGVALWIARPLAFAFSDRRGEATVLFENRAGDRLLRALFDERIVIEPVNRHEPAGGRTLAFFVKGRPVVRRVLALEDGDVFQVRLEADGRVEIARKPEDSRSRAPAAASPPGS